MHENHVNYITRGMKELNKDCTDPSTYHTDIY